MSELPVEYLVAVNEFMAAIARGEKLTPRLAHDCGYDIHALQQCMDLVAPQLTLLSGYKPLVLWLRYNDSMRITSEQDLKAHKSMLRVMSLYVKTNVAGDKIHSSQTVDVYVSRDGQYVVTILEKPDALRQDMYTKEFVVGVVECGSARDIAVVLNPMQLQTDPYDEYHPRSCIVSPAMYVAEKLRTLTRARIQQHANELTNLQSSATGMATAMQP